MPYNGPFCIVRQTIIDMVIEGCLQGFGRPLGLRLCHFSARKNWHVLAEAWEMVVMETGFLDANMANHDIPTWPTLVFDWGV